MQERGHSIVMFDQHNIMFLFFDLLQNNIPGVSELGFIKMFKGRVHELFLHANKNDVILTFLNTDSKHYNAPMHLMSGAISIMKWRRFGSSGGIHWAP